VVEASARAAARHAPLPVEGLVTAAGKVLPSGALLVGYAQATAAAELEAWTREQVEQRLDLAAVVARLTRCWKPFTWRAVRPRRPWRWVEASLERDPQQSWEGVLGTASRQSLRAHLRVHRTELLTELVEALRQQLEDVQQTLAEDAS
jgi:hypothetical protein